MKNPVTNTESRSASCSTFARRKGFDQWPVLATQLAIIYALCGEKDLAIEQLNANFRRPGDGSYGDLRLNPVWDPLRGDPRFEKLVASLAPKD